MKRKGLENLQAWKSSAIRKPLIIRGARQVGKTWLMREFGKTNFEHYIYVNFEENQNLQSIFKENFDIPRIISILEIHSGNIITPSNTLIIFDEIQTAERGLTALKYFCENAPELFVIAAGSLLGITMTDKSSFPVGKVDFIDLHPLSFEEFLWAMGEEKMNTVLAHKSYDTIHIFKDKLINLLRTYYYIGGMPEVVATFIQHKNYDEARLIQKRILTSYETDFSKYAPIEIVPRIRMVWQSISAQLAKENKKFIYGVIREGARAKDFELAIQWLFDAGLVLQIHRITKPELPLTAFKDFSCFKLFLLDTGLLSAMVGLDTKTLIEGNELYLQYKGALTEQFVAQQLVAMENTQIYYWTNERSTSEVDFVIQTSNRIIAIEVKAEQNLKSKSFRFFCDKYQTTDAIRLSLANYTNKGWMKNIPLYCVGNILLL